MTILFLLGSALPALAEESADPKVDLFIKQGLQVTAQESGFITNINQTPKSITRVVGDSIEILLGVIGIIFLIFMLYAGVLYLTAGGEEDKVKKAKRLIADSVIGIIIVVAAYALTRFVVQLLINAAS